ncbi:MAG TPA: hypothetical protein VFU43_07340 [Streptosporangiaceae bacterium]|nr:hypothetical protein [Streptosporangiaceae bacterium]
MAGDEVIANFEAIKKSGDKVLDASIDWGHAGDDVWWAKLPDNALGRAGSDSGLIADYANLCDDVNAELREGSRTLGMAAAALWKVAKTYRDTEEEVRKRVLEDRGFDPHRVPKSYW